MLFPDRVVAAAQQAIAKQGSTLDSASLILWVRLPPAVT